MVLEKPLCLRQETRAGRGPDEASGAAEAGGCRLEGGGGGGRWHLLSLPHTAPTPPSGLLFRPTSCLMERRVALPPPESQATLCPLDATIFPPARPLALKPWELKSVLCFWNVVISWMLCEWDHRGCHPPDWPPPHHADPWRCCQGACSRPGVPGAAGQSPRAARARAFNSSVSAQHSSPAIFHKPGKPSPKIHFSSSQGLAESQGSQRMRSGCRGAGWSLRCCGRGHRWTLGTRGVRLWKQQKPARPSHARTWGHPSPWPLALLLTEKTSQEHDGVRAGTCAWWPWGGRCHKSLGWSPGSRCRGSLGGPSALAAWQPGAFAANQALGLGCSASRAGATRTSPPPAVPGSLHGGDVGVSRMHRGGPRVPESS